VSLNDTEARELIRHDLDASMIVEAAAGTGKTTMLVDRLVEALATGRAEIQSVAAVTFTNKAAGELKLRLRQKLDEARASETDADRRAHLVAAIARLEEASIGTIHALCAQILRERPVEAGIDPAFGEIDAEEARRLYDRAFRSWIERRLDDMPEGLSRALSRLAAQPSFDGSTPVERLADAGWKLSEWRDYPAPWTRRPFDRAAEIDALIARVAELAELHDSNDDAGDPLRQAIAPAWRLHEWIRRSEEVAPRDRDAIEGRLGEALRELRKQQRRKGRGSWPVKGVSRADVARRRDELIEAIADFSTAADADLAALLQHELHEVVEAYDQLKRSTGKLDFLDLLIRTRDMVRDRPEVRAHLQSSFTHLFVDEFQDTDPLQVEILLLLAADEPGATDWRAARPVPGKLFLVGDPKQSIYRFRRADVVLYQQIKRVLVEAGVRLVYLSKSWRSVQPIQATVNAAFAAEMTGDDASGQPEYVPLEHQREPRPWQPSVVALPVPRPYSDWGRVTSWQLAHEQPDVVGAWLHWLFEESGWQVTDPRTREARPVEPSDVAILFRRFLSWGRDVTRPYLSALEARGIPHLLAGGRSFHQREEVETLRAGLTAIEWPDDELSVFATLKGSLFAVPDEDLLRFREEIGSLHPFRRLPDDLGARGLGSIGEALQLLAALHRRRNRRPIAETVLELLEATRAHAAFAMRPAGNQVLANVQRVCDLARAFEMRGGLSFRGFVQRLADEAERPGSTEAPLLEEGAEGVRLMTVHGAKGLEFPVVVLADITAQLARAHPDTYIDPVEKLCATRLLGCSPWELVDNADVERRRDAAEGVRLAYVAATRARDLLVVPTVGDGPWDDGWVSPLNRALYPPRQEYRRSRTAAGCPEFGDRSVLERPERAHGETEISVRPGLHRSDAGEEVVWWDPGVLDLGVPPNFGLRQEELLSEDEARAAEGRHAHEAWIARRKTILEAGARPSERIVVVSEATEPPPGFETEIRVERVDRSADRPGGRRFGTLVHTALRDLPPDANGETISAVVRVHGRALGAPEQEMEAAAEVVGATLRHPVMTAAGAAPACHRETPFTLRLDDGTLVEGAIDLVFGDGEQWTIVDFKTDARDEGLEDRYRHQALWYAAAVERLLGGRARTVLLSV
jgi:ATP-dependent exoDNAse (exonuclease V) beta subunit